jgi:hypothetical protein
MKFYRAFIVGLSVTAVAACNSDPVSHVVTPAESAAVRFVNAIPDTVAMDYRFVTYPSNASEPALAFQSSSGNWRIIPAGTHTVRAFFTNNTAAGDAVSVVSQVISEGSFPLGAGKKYTILHYGFAKAATSPQKQLVLIEDVVPTVPAGQVAIRVINAAPAFGNINVYAAAAAATGGAVAGTPAFSNVAPGAVTAWVNFPVTTGSNVYRMTATPAASTTINADFLAPAGAAAVAATATSAALDAVPGSRIGQSAFTIVVFGPKVAYVLRTPSGGTSNVAGTATGAMTALLDVWPPRISP